MNMQNYVRLPLKNAYNVRDLGGYPNSRGQVTKWHVFIRSDDLHYLDEEDIDFLLDYGVKAIIDLRSNSEIGSSPNPFATIEQVSYINIPLAANNIGDAAKVIEKPNEFLRNFYMEIISKSSIAIKYIFRFISSQTEGCILFHCAAGKDRTGIITMLLLGLFDVCKYDIISNYEVTYSHLRQSPVTQELAKSLPIETMYSNADYIEPVIDYILNTYGGFESYLLAIGVSEKVLSTIKEASLVNS